MGGQNGGEGGLIEVLKALLTLDQTLLVLYALHLRQALRRTLSLIFKLRAFLIRNFSLQNVPRPRKQTSLNQSERKTWARPQSRRRRTLLEPSASTRRWRQRSRTKRGWSLDAGRWPTGPRCSSSELRPGWGASWKAGWSRNWKVSDEKSGTILGWGSNAAFAKLYYLWGSKPNLKQLNWTTAQCTRLTVESNTTDKGIATF